MNNKELVEWAENLMVSSPRLDGYTLVKNIKDLSVYIRQLEVDCNTMRTENINLYGWLNAEAQEAGKLQRKLDEEYTRVMTWMVACSNARRGQEQAIEQRNRAEAKLKEALHLLTLILNGAEASETSWSDWLNRAKALTNE